MNLIYNKQLSIMFACLYDANNNKSSTAGWSDDVPNEHKWNPLLLTYTEQKPVLFFCEMKF